MHDTGRLNQRSHRRAGSLKAAGGSVPQTLWARMSVPRKDEPRPRRQTVDLYPNCPNTKIELLYPAGRGQPDQRVFGKKPAGGIHHIA